MNKKNALLKKKSIKIMYGIIFFLFFNVTCTSRNVFYSTIIVVIAATVLIFIYFFKVAWKTLDEKDFYLFYGVTGLLTSFVFALLAAVQKIGTKGEKFLTFAVILCILLIVIGFMEFFSKKRLSKTNKTQNSSIGTGLVALSGLAGMAISKYLRYMGVVIEFEFVLSGISLFFSIFYLFLIKYRKLCQSELDSNQSNDGSKPLKE